MKLSSARHTLFLLLTFGLLELSIAQPILLPEDREDLQIKLETLSDFQVLAEDIDLGDRKSVV